MSLEMAQSPTWSPLKWTALIGCILALHAGLFLWFARPSVRPPQSSQAGPGTSTPVIQSGDLPGSINPLLLVRPDARGFSGPAWLQIPPLTYNPEVSNPQPFLLSLQSERLGAGIAGALSNTLSRPFEVARRPEQTRDKLNYFPALNEKAPASSVAVEGDIAGRSPALPVLGPQPADTVLSNTVVQITVDAEGNEFTPPVILESSGSADADAEALNVARNLRFQALLRTPGRPPPAPTSLSDGQLVFQWQTVPKTTAAVAEPSSNR
jgi:hypothetical protein